jgi:hypothetical protein
VIKRVLAGTFIAGLPLAFFSPRSTLSCLLAGFFATILALQLGPRSVVERAGAVLLAGAIAWLAGPRAAAGQSLLEHLIGWTLAAFALSIWLHPRED